MKRTLAIAVSCLMLTFLSCSKKDDGGPGPGNGEPGGSLDIDQDGRTDLIILRVASAQGIWQLNVFSDGLNASDLAPAAASITVDGSGFVSDLATCDLDGDDLTDLLIAAPPDIDVWLGSDFASWNGDTPTLSITSVDSFRVECADVTGDGAADILTEFYDQGVFQPGLAVVPGGSTFVSGQFDFASLTSVIPLNDVADPGVRDWGFGDVNGDGTQDIFMVATNNPGSPVESGSIAIHLGGATLSPAPSFPGNLSIAGADGADIQVTLADVDGDGTTDVIRSIDSVLEIYAGASLGPSGNTPSSSIPLSTNPNHVLGLDAYRYNSGPHALAISTLTSLYRTEIRGSIDSASTCSARSPTATRNRAFSVVGIGTALVQSLLSGHDHIDCVGGDDDDDDAGAECTTSETAAQCTLECEFESATSCGFLDLVDEEPDLQYESTFADCVADC